MALTAATQTQLYEFFSIAFDAVPGVTYMGQLAEAVNAGMTVPQIVEVFTTKVQFTSVYPVFYTNQQFASKLIENVVGDSASAAAKAEAIADVEGALAAGWSRGKVIYQIFSNLAAKNPADPVWGDTAQMMANKVAVAKYVTETQLFDTTDMGRLQAVIADVTADTNVSTPAAIQYLVAGVVGQGFTVSANAPTVVEGDSGVKNMVFELKLAQTPLDPVTLNFKTLATGTATSGEDFVDVAGTVTFAAGQTVATVSVPVAGDVKFEGDETLRLEVSGSKLAATVVATGTILNDDVANRAPVASNLVAGGHEDGSIAGSVFASDADGNAVSYSLVNGPANGTLVLNANGTYTYTPKADFNGTDSFTYKANDGTVDSNVATVTLNVAAVNDAPVARAVQVSATEDALPLVGNLAASGTVTDIDSANLTFSLVSGAPGFSLEANGNARFDPSAAAFQHLKAGEVVNVTANYQVTDGALSATNTITFTVTGTNDLPVATNVTVSGYENIKVTGQVTATDVDGDALTFAASNAVNGTVVMDAATGNYVFTPAADFNGTASFDYIANDGTGNSAVRTVTIKVADVVNILTSGQDSISLLNGNLAETVLGTNNNLNAGDVVRGGAEDTVYLSIDQSLALNNFAGFRLQGVGTFAVTNDDNGAVTFDLSSSDGLTHVQTSNSTQAISFNQLTNNVALDVINLTTAASSDVTVQYRDSVVAGADDVMNVNLIGSDADVIRIGRVGDANAGIETINLDVQMRAATLGQLDTNMTALNITGGNNLTINTVLNSTVRNVNASTIGGAFVNLSVADATGNVTINTADGADTIVGSSHNDTINVAGGNNSVQGNGGNDTITAANGNNTITTWGVGADSITVGNGNNTITTWTLAGLGDDTVVAGNGNNTISSSNGDDQITVGNGSNQITSRGGDDTIVAGGVGAAGSNLIDAGDGIDSVTITSSGNQTVVAGAGDDSVTINGNGNNNVNAGTGNDSVTINGNGNNTVDAGAGNDSVSTGDGNDDITMGAGVDTVISGGGNDIIRAGANLDASGSGAVFDPIQDQIVGGEGNDELRIDASDRTDGHFRNVSSIETLTIETAGNTQIAGFAQNAGIRTVNALNAGADNLNASAYTADLTVNLAGGNDSVSTGSGNDTITANGNGNHSIHSGAGNDTVTLNGTGVVNVNLADGNDAVSLGDVTDADTLAGGSGIDTLTLDQDTTLTVANHISGFETIVLGSQRDGSRTATEMTSLGIDSRGHQYVIALDNDNAPAPNVPVLGSEASTAAVLTIDGSALKADTDGSDVGGVLANETLAFDGSAINSYRVSVLGGDANDTITSGHYDDTIRSGAGSDTVNLVAGNNVVEAGLGNDTVTLGTGHDSVDAGSGNDRIVAAAQLNQYDTIDGGADTDTLAVNAGTVDIDYTQVSHVEILELQTAGTTVLDAEAQEAGIRTVNLTAGADRLEAAGFTASLTVNAGNGNDTVTTGSGDDLVNGGDGNDSITTNAGNDSVFAGAGDDVISTGEGQDYVEIGSGSDNVNLGAGNDTVRVTGTELDVLDSIAGGAGTDTVELAGNVTAVVNLDHVTSVENYTALAGAAADITFTNGDVTTLNTINVDGKDAASLTVTLGAGQDDSDYAFNITGSAARDVFTKANVGVQNNLSISGGDGEDRFVFNADDLGASVSLAGGNGEDALMVTGGKLTDDDFTNISGIERINLAVPATTLDFTETLVSFEVDRASVYLVAGVTYTLQQNNAGLGDPEFQLLDRDGVTVLATDDDSGAGLNAQITFTPTVSGEYFLNLGVYPYPGDGDAGNYQVLVTSTATPVSAVPLDAQLGAQADRAGIAFIDGSTGNDNVVLDAAFDNDLTVRLFQGNDRFNAGNSNSAVSFYSALSDITAADSLSGGKTAGDKLVLAADSGTANLSNVIGVETVRIQEVADNSATLDITDNTFTGVVGSTITIDASDLNDVDAEGALTVNAGGVTGSRHFVVTGGTGDDSITTGAGNDSIVAGLGNNLVDAGDGNNTVRAGNGNDTITTGAGDDLIFMGAGNNVVNSGAGNDTISNVSGNNSVNAGTGNDSITLSNGNNTVDAGAGDDRVTVGDGNNTIWGGDGNDSITAGLGHNYIEGGAGNDSILATGGDNTILAGAGNDSITVGDGNNTISAGAGNDVIVVGNGDNTITAGAGADSITLGSGENTVRYTMVSESQGLLANRDTVVGFSSDDKLFIETNLLGAGVTNVRFIGDAVDSEDAAAGIAASKNDHIADAVYNAQTGRLLIDLNDDGQIDGQDLVIEMRDAAGHPLSAGVFGLGNANIVVGDTIKPAAPTLIDLLSVNDTGFSGTDNVTNDSSVLIRVHFQTTETDGTQVKAGNVLTLVDDKGGVYTHTLTAGDIEDGYHTFFVNLSDAASPVNGVVNTLTATISDGINVSDSARQAITLDRVHPTLTISDSDADTVNIADGTVTFTFTFDEPVRGFAAADIAVTNGAKGAFAAVAADADGFATTYTLVVTPTAGFEGDVTVDVNANAASDRAGNGNNSYPAVYAQAADMKTPTLLISDDEADVANIAGGTVTYTFQFSEVVTGFTADDITVTNGAKGLFTAVDGDTYTLVVDPSDNFEGTMTVSVAAGAAADLAGNPTTAAYSHDQAVDTLAPTIEISSPVMGDNQISAAEDQLFTVGGSTHNVQAGQTVTVTITDTEQSLSVVTTATVLADGTWATPTVDLFAVFGSSIDATGDTLSIVAEVADQAGNPASDTFTTAEYDNVAPVAGTVDFVSVSEEADTSPALNDGDNLANAVTNQETGTVVFHYVTDLNAAYPAEERFQYSVDGGAHWTDVPAADVNAAVNTVSIKGLDLHVSPTVDLRAIDQAGNITDLASQTISHDDTAPANTASWTSLTQEADSTGTSNNGDSDITDGRTNVQNVDVVFTYVGSDLDYGATVKDSWQYTIDGGSHWIDVAAANVDDIANIVTVSLDLAVTGNVTVGLRAIDGAGNETAQLASKSIVYDISAPNVGTVTFVTVEQDAGSTPDNKDDHITNVATADVVFAYAGADLGTGENFQYSVDGGTTWTDIPNGAVDTSLKHVTIADLDVTSSPTVLIRTIDVAGNETGTLATQDIVYDNVAPTVTAALYNNLSNTLTLTGTGFTDFTTHGNGTVNADSITWDINDDGATTADYVLPADGEGSTVTIVNDTTVTIALDGASATQLESITANFIGNVEDNLDLAPAALIDAAGNPIASTGLYMSYQLTGSINPENIFGGRLNDTLDGGLGADTIVGQAGSDSILGNDGNDVLWAGLGVDTVLGGDQDDQLVIVGSLTAPQAAGYNTSGELSNVLGYTVTLAARADSDAANNGLGEVYQGGAGIDTLHIFGTVDTTAATITGIENSVVHSTWTLSLAQLNSLQTLTVDGAGEHTLVITDNLGNPLTAAAAATAFQDWLKADNGVGQQFYLINADASTKLIVQGSDTSNTYSGSDAIWNYVGTYSLEGVNRSEPVIDDTYTRGYTGGTGAVNDTNGGTNDRLQLDQGSSGLTGLEFLHHDSTDPQSYDMHIDLNNLGTIHVTDHFAGHPVEELVFINTGTYEGYDFNQGGSTGSVVYLMSTDVGGTGASGTITGTSGNDVLAGRYSDNRNETLNGGSGHDLIFGGSGNDSLDGGDGNDLLVGGAGTDTLKGGNGNDVLLGGSGNDKLYGDAGNDSLIGGASNDTMFGGAGDDYFDLTSGGSDVIVFGSSSVLNGADTIVGFDAGSGGDELNFKDFGVGSGIESNGSGFVGDTSAFTGSYGSGATGFHDLNGKVALYNAGSGNLANVDTAGEVANLFSGTGDWFKMATNGKGVLLTGATNSTTVYAWFIENDGTAAVTSSEVTLVGTMTLAAGDSISSFHTDNFNFTSLS